MFTKDLIKKAVTDHISEKRAMLIQQYDLEADGDESDLSSAYGSSQYLQQALKKVALVRHDSIN